LLKVAKSFDLTELKQIQSSIDPQGAVALASQFQNMQALVDYDTLIMGGFYQDKHISLLHQTIDHLDRPSGEQYGGDSQKRCKDSVIAKIMRLRITVREMAFNWKTSWNNLDDTVELFLDNSITLNFEHYRRKIDTTVRNIPIWMYRIDQEYAKRIRDTFEYTISCIFACALG